MSDSQIDWTKPVRCKQGGHVMRVLCTDSGSPNYPVIMVDAFGQVFRATKDGSGRPVGGQSLAVTYNFENVPEKHELYVSFYRLRSGEIVNSVGRRTRAESDKHASDDRISCQKITIEIGRFDD